MSFQRLIWHPSLRAILLITRWPCQVPVTVAVSGPP